MEMNSHVEEDKLMNDILNNEDNQKGDILKEDNRQADILPEVDTQAVGSQLGDSLLVMDILLLGMNQVEEDRVLMDNSLLNVRTGLSH